MGESLCTSRNTDRAQAASRNAVLTYATHHLGVQHIIVMGHYGCGGVAAAITSSMASEKDAKDSIDHWVWPIRDTYLKSTRFVFPHRRND